MSAQYLAKGKKEVCLKLKRLALRYKQCMLLDEKGLRAQKLLHDSRQSYTAENPTATGS